MNTRVQRFLLIFLIGATGGAIAAVFPRLFTALFASNAQIDVQLFSSVFWLLVLAFALIVGISMVFFHADSTDGTKQLFTAALSLPAVLSGALNMSSATAGAQATIQDVQRTATELAQELQDARAIPEIDLDPGAALEFLETPIGHQFDPMSLLGISPAMAQSTAQTVSRTTWGVRFTPQDAKPSYLVTIATANDATQLNELKDRYARVQGVPKLAVVRQSANEYLLVTSALQSKSDAVLAAVDLSRKLDVEPELLRVAK